MTLSQTARLSFPAWDGHAPGGSAKMQSYPLLVQAKVDRGGYVSITKTFKHREQVYRDAIKLAMESFRFCAIVCLGL